MLTVCINGPSDITPDSSVRSPFSGTEAPPQRPAHNERIDTRAAPTATATPPPPLPSTAPPPPLPPPAATRQHPSHINQATRRELGGSRWRSPGPPGLSGDRPPSQARFGWIRRPRMNRRVRSLAEINRALAGPRASTSHMTQAVLHAGVKLLLHRGQMCRLCQAVSHTDGEATLLREARASLILADAHSFLFFSA